MKIIKTNIKKKKFKKYIHAAVISGKFSIR